MYNIIIIVCLIILFFTVLLGLIVNSQISNKNFVEKNSATNYRLLVSAQCKAYQDWQSVGVYWSAKKHWPGVGYTRLLSCSPVKRVLYKYHETVPSYLASDWSKHPDTGDDYPPYNRPISIKEYFERGMPQEEYMIIIDPDTIIRKPLNDIPVSRGKPVAQRYDYLYNKNALSILGKKFLGTDKDLQPLGMPMIIHKEDLARLAPLWLEYTEKIRQDPECKELSEWVAEMHSYCLAAAHLKLKHTVRNNLADRTPYNRMDDPYVLHYDLKHKCSNFEWDKRDYMNGDLLTGNSLMPTPDNPPNERFSQVFDTINEALIECRKHNLDK